MSWRRFYTTFFLSFFATCFEGATTFGITTHRITTQHSENVNAFLLCRNLFSVLLGVDVVSFFVISVVSMSVVLLSVGAPY